MTKLSNNIFLSDGKLLTQEAKLNVLSCFDGMSCLQIALDKLGIPINKYFASEIDKYAMKVTQANYPNTIQLGNIEFITKQTFGSNKIQLFAGGSPCQSFSRGGDQSGFDGKSRLFWEYVRLLKELKIENPNLLFLLENVKMKQEWQDVITHALGVEPIRINSKLVSGQTRDRLYWTNIPGVEVPKDKGILLETILESGEVDRDKAYRIDANYFKGTNASQYISKSRRQIVWVIPEATKKGFVKVGTGQCIDLTFIKSKTRRGRLMLEKSNCLTASSQNLCKVTNDWFRKLTPIECERLQTVPDNYTNHVSNSQRYKMIGNGWTVDVIAHILKGMSEKKEGKKKNIVTADMHEPLIKTGT